MKKYSANYIFPVSSKPLKNGIVVVDDNGYIVDLIDTKGQLREIAGLEFYNGVIVPGFVNCHCHLELSALKGLIPKFIGLAQFIMKIRELRFEPDNIINAMKEADLQMQRSGIVAVGDISNTTVSFQTKKESKVYYHNFIEIFGASENIAYERFEDAKNIVNQALNDFNFKQSQLSLTPHAWYSVADILFNLIGQYHYNEIISIHNQESEDENHMLFNRTGDIMYMYEKTGIDMSGIKRNARSSLLSGLQLIEDNKNLLLVHNTFTKPVEVEQTKSYNGNIFWILCPESNYYISKSYPNPLKFDTNKIALGTDSLASNDELSILNEMKALLKHYSKLKFDEILRWGTINGAKALKIDNIYGSIEKGKKPGLAWIKHFDFNEMKPKPQSTMKLLYS